MPSPNPVISVVIVTWNSALHLPKCLAALRSQTFKDFEAIIVDNGSADECTEDLGQRYPEMIVRVEKLALNQGFAAANNIGARLAQGEWLVLLNADAFPEADWLEQLLNASKKSPDRSFFSSRQLQANDLSRLDGEGDVLHVSGLAWRHNYHAPVYPAARMQPVFSACGAAAMYPRQAFLDAGGFDEDYFSYFEDVDLGFRLRLAGYECLFVPGAVVHHVGSASTGKTSDFVIYHGHRNLVWTYFKDMPAVLFWFYLPLHLVMNLFYLASFTLQGQAGPIWRSKWDGLRGLGGVLKKRRLAQQNRRASVERLHRAMDHSLWALFRKRAQRRHLEQKPVPDGQG